MKQTKETVSVVLVTYQRPDACERALCSALAQTRSPLEILVCDDASQDDTEERFRAWERRDERVRYLRSRQNSGGPAATRNMGIEQARGEWIAFLDDDDEWLPHKLATQLQAASDERVDLVAANAQRSSGLLYFPYAPPRSRPGAAQLVKTNPVIMSSVLVRRSLLVSIGGLPAQRWVSGIDEYSAWLALSRIGTRFLVLGAPLVRYEDASGERLSGRRIRGQLALARVLWEHTIRRLTWPGLMAAARESVGVPYVVGEEAVRRLRRYSAASTMSLFLL